MADLYRINGNVLSWASITCKIADERFWGFTDLSYGDKRERVKQYGMARHHAPRGRSHGKYSTEPVKLGGPKSTVHALRETLAQRSPDGISYGDVEFQIVAEYFETDDWPLIVVIEHCVIVGNTSSESESPDPLKEELEIDCMYIRRNEYVLFDATDGQP